MSKIIGFLRRINPFREVESNSKLEYVIQKVAAFIILYFGSSVLMEGVIILILLINGFDVLHGQLPASEWITVLPLYGMVGFAAMTILYIKLVEKRTLADMEIKWGYGFIKSIVKGLLLGIGLVALMLAFLMVFGQYSFESLENASPSSLFVWFAAYFIQASSEELMCRGFLQTSLSRRLKTRTAVIISSIMFAFPHMSSLSEMNGTFQLIAVINLLLVSILFSLAMISEKSLGMACGIHIGWNYFLGSIFGLEVSGRSVTGSMFRFMLQSDKNILNGGSYGIEASILPIPILTLCIAFYARNLKRRERFGIQQETI